MTAKKKTLMLVIAVTSLAVAGGIAFMRMRGTGDSLNTISPDEKIWVKCSDDKCNATYEINFRDYLKFIRDNASSLQVPPLVCQKCNMESVYRAVKCGKCGNIFFYASVPNDYEDRCPNCGFSKIEQGRKAADGEKSAAK